MPATENRCRLLYLQGGNRSRHSRASARCSGRCSEQRISCWSVCRSVCRTTIRTAYCPGWWSGRCSEARACAVLSRRACALAGGSECDAGVSAPLRCRAWGRAFHRARPALLYRRGTLSEQRRSAAIGSGAGDRLRALSARLCAFLFRALPGGSRSAARSCAVAAVCRGLLGRWRAGDGISQVAGGRRAGRRCRRRSSLGLAAKCRHRLIGPRLRRWQRLSAPARANREPSSAKQPPPCWSTCETHCAACANEQETWP